MKEALDEPELSLPEQLELARKMRSGDLAAEQRLVASGLRYVILHALRLGYRGAALDDAVQDGAVGLLGALRRFDPDHGVGLATFAWSWINGAICRAHRVGPEVPSDRLPDREQPAAAGVGDDIDTRELLELLPSGQRRIVMLRYGFAGPALSRSQVAAVLGLKESQVRTVETQALCSLRTSFAGTVFPTGRTPC